MIELLFCEGFEFLFKFCGSLVLQATGVWSVCSENQTETPRHGVWGAWLV